MTQPYGYDKNQGMEKTQFVFHTCNPGFERLIKEEYAGLSNGYQAAFQRPGFLTFKGPFGAAVHRPLFANTSGLCFGKMSAKTFQELPKEINSRRFDRIHYFSRFSIHEDLSHVMHEWNQQADALVRLGINERFFSKGQAGEHVLDVVRVEEDQWWWGMHILEPNGPIFSGGRSVVKMEKKISRAYYKIAELFHRFHLNLATGRTALEIGSAPGGTCQFLTELGLTVIGIDRGEMDKELLKSHLFSHLKLSFNESLKVTLPEKIDWLLIDINEPPPTAIKAFEVYLQRYQQVLKGAVVTLKMNDHNHIEKITEYVNTLKLLSGRNTEIVHHIFHHQEIAVIVS